MTPNPTSRPMRPWAGATYAALPAHDFGPAASDLGLVALREAYRPSGGIARGDDLGRLLEDYCCGDFVNLARWIVGGRVFGFEWHHTLWLPMFQFETHGLAPKPGLIRVLAELPPELEGWTLAAWFARANHWLNGRRPADLLDSARGELIVAARRYHLPVEA